MSERRLSLSASSAVPSAASSIRSPDESREMDFPNWERLNSRTRCEFSDDRFVLIVNAAMFFSSLKSSGV
jgi:hypothetical protein